MIARQGPAPIVLVSTMALTFIASLAVMLRHRSVERPAAAAIVESYATAAAAPTTSPSAPDTGAAADPADLRPVLIVVRNNRRSEEIEATAKNDSNQPVSVTLAAEDGWGEILSIETFDLDAGETRRFGAIHGLPLPSGGKIRIRIPGNIDREVDIPL